MKKYLFLLLLPHYVFASAVTPVDDTEIVFVLEKVSGSESQSDLVQKIQKHRNNPEDYYLSHELAKTYIELAKSENNVRYFGRAQAVIKPWWDSRDSRMLLFKAAILQFNHEFSPAIEVLTQILKQEPLNFQARLMRANIYLVTGNYERSYRDCVSLSVSGAPLLSAVCAAGSSGMMLEDDEFNDLSLRLNSMLTNDNSVPNDYQAWMISVFSDLLMARGQYVAAEKILNKTLNYAPNNLQLLSLMADLFLHQQRYLEVIELLRDHKEHTSMLLRLAIAEKRLNRVKVLNEYIEELEMRFKEDALRGQRLHLRESAYFTLYVKDDVEAAIELVNENWQQQKEISDMRLLYDVSRLNKSKNVEEELVQWKQTNNLRTQSSNISFLGG